MPVVASTLRLRSPTKNALAGSFSNTMFFMYFTGTEGDAFSKRRNNYGVFSNMMTRHAHRHKNDQAFVDRMFNLFDLNGMYRYFYIIRGSYVSAHVLWNLLNELRKRDKMRGLPKIKCIKKIKNRIFGVKPSRCCHL